jgi:hypothetical protein
MISALTDPDAAARHFDDALAIHRRIGARTWLARTERDAKRLLG